jgi:hypothetical protein
MDKNNSAEPGKPPSAGIIIAPRGDTPATDTMHLSQNPGCIRPAAVARRLRQAASPYRDLVSPHRLPCLRTPRFASMLRRGIAMDFKRVFSRRAAGRFHLFAGITPFLMGILTQWSSGWAETVVKGDISGVVFKSSNNPFVVDSSIVIPDGKNVTVDGGCVFLFKEFTDLEVKGGLRVAGDSVSPVIFTSFNDQAFNKKSGQAANPFDWKGIHVLHGAGNIGLKNFRLMFSVYGIKCESSQIIIENGIFRQNGRSSVEINGKKSAVNDNEPVFMTIAPEEPKSNAIATFIGRGDATLFIETEPSGAEISIENVKIPKVSPVRIDSIVAGQYSIKAQKDQMIGSMNIVVENGEIKRAIIKLEQQKTVVRVITEPPDAEVFMKKKNNETRKMRPRHARPAETRSGTKKPQPLIL